jgi:hypothetical protein
MKSLVSLWRATLPPVCSSDERIAMKKFIVVLCLTLAVAGEAFVSEVDAGACPTQRAAHKKTRSSPSCTSAPASIIIVVPTLQPTDGVPGYTTPRPYPYDGGGSARYPYQPMPLDHGYGATPRGPTPREAYESAPHQHSYRCVPCIDRTWTQAPDCTCSRTQWRPGPMR